MRFNILRNRRATIQISLHLFEKSPKLVLIEALPLDQGVEWKDIQAAFPLEVRVWTLCQALRGARGKSSGRTLCQRAQPPPTARATLRADQGKLGCETRAVFVPGPGRIDWEDAQGRWCGLRARGRAPRGRAVPSRGAPHPPRWSRPRRLGSSSSPATSASSNIAHRCERFFRRRQSSKRTRS